MTTAGSGLEGATDLAVMEAIVQRRYGTAPEEVLAPSATSPRDGPRGRSSSRCDAHAS